MSDKAEHATPESEKVYIDYAEGKLSRHVATDRLGIEYWQLLDGLASRGLRIPRLPDEEVEQAAMEMLRFLGRR